MSEQEPIPKPGVLEIAILALRSSGNPVDLQRAEIIEAMLQERGEDLVNGQRHSRTIQVADVGEPVVYTGREPEMSGVRLGLTRSNLDMAQDQEIWNTGFGRQLEYPQVSDEQLRQFERIWATASPFFLEPKAHIGPGLTLRDIALPGLRIRPPEHFWQWVNSGRVPRSAVEFPPAFIIFEAAAKPDWQDGMQLYRDDDPRGQVVQESVQNGLINRGAYYSEVPPQSLFAISPTEWSQVVLPALAQRMQLEGTGAKLSLTPYLLFNLMGNLFYPQLGRGTTGEWFADQFEGGYRLCGGYSGYGGLASVYYVLTSYRSDDLGGRPLLVHQIRA